MATTSSHFPIAVLGAARTRGQIGMSFCPGRAPYSWLGHLRARDLLHDLGTIARWGTRIVITAMQQAELLQLQLDELTDRLRSADIDWHLLPFPPHGVPWPGFERDWSVLATHLSPQLVAGSKILIHCRDGIHRSGFVAARMLIELGCPPQDAINRVRAAQPGAIAVQEQERDLLLLSRQDAALPLNTNVQQELDLGAVQERIQSPSMPLLNTRVLGAIGNVTHASFKTRGLAARRTETR